MPPFMTAPIGLTHYLVLSAFLFLIGTAGVLLRRNIIVMFMGIELMLNGAMVALAAFGRYRGENQGSILVLFAIAVAASEAAVGLAALVAFYRRRETANVDRANILRW